MKINRENYGRFIIDYYDGQLSSEEERELMLFLEGNSDLKTIFESYSEFPVVPEEQVKFSGKDTLKKQETEVVGHITEDNFEEYLVLLLDGELAENEKKKVELFLEKNPHLQSELRHLFQTKLVPDKTIVYQNKSVLKHHRAISPWFRIAGMAAAAVLLLFFSIHFFFNNPSPKAGVGQFALESLPLKTAEISFVKVSPELFVKKPVIRGKTVLKRKTIPEKDYRTSVLQSPVKMMAMANVYVPLTPEKDYVPLLFPKGKTIKETIALSVPVVVEKPVGNRFIRHTIGKPFSQLAEFLALQKKRKKLARTHDKGFVKVLESGVTAMNFLTDNNVIMVKTYNAKGNLIDYQLLSDNFSINRPVKEGR